MPHPGPGVRLNTGRTHFKKGQIPWNKKPPVIIACKICGKKFQIKPARIKTAKYCSYYCSVSGTKSGVSLSDSHRRAISASRKGPGHHNWKGGITAKTRRQRLVEDSILRDKAFERDNFTCQFCGKKESLEIHHIKRYSLYPELRYEMTNVITLCADCHRNRTVHGGRNPRRITPD